MTLHEITAFYNDDFDELKKEFKIEFNRIIEDGDSEGLHPFYFCYYKDYQLHTELCYCMITPKTAVFLLSPCRLTLMLNEKFEVESGDISPDSVVFEKLLSNSDDSDLVYIDSIYNRNGHGYFIYSLKYTKPKKELEYMVENEMIDIERINVNEDEMTEIALDYLEQKIEYFNNKIDEAIDLDSPYVGIDENPYANRFYDKEYNMRSHSIRLGDNNV